MRENKTLLAFWIGKKKARIGRTGRWFLYRRPDGYAILFIFFCSWQTFNQEVGEEKSQFGRFGRSELRASQRLFFWENCIDSTTLRGTNKIPPGVSQTVSEPNRSSSNRQFIEILILASSGWIWIWRGTTAKTPDQNLFEMHAIILVVWLSCKMIS